MDDTSAGADDWDFASLTPDRILGDLETLGWRCDGRMLALNSYENRVYQIGIEDDDPVVAKFYRPGRWSADALREEHRFVAELDERDVPVVAALQSTATGERLNYCNPWWIAVYPRRGGYALEMDQAEQLYRVGQVLGRLHLVGEQRAFEWRPELNSVDFGDRAIERVLASALVPTDMRAVYDGVANDLLTRVKRALEDYGEITRLRLHGDCHASNVLVRDERLLLVDFDDARSGPAIQDIWLFLSGDTASRNAALAELVEGYEEFRAFPLRELALIAPLASLRLLHYAGWLAERWTDPAFPAAFPWFGEARYWDQHVLDLREQIAAMQEPHGLKVAPGL
ncbi:MAG: serine/threonine protein kinase [Pseudomonadota bacterium]